jgi:hypothetical protein
MAGNTKLGSIGIFNKHIKATPEQDTKYRSQYENYRNGTMFNRKFHRGFCFHGRPIRALYRTGNL